MLQVGAKEMLQTQKVGDGKSSVNDKFSVARATSCLAMFLTFALACFCLAWCVLHGQNCCHVTGCFPWHVQIMRVDLVASPGEEALSFSEVKSFTQKEGIPTAQRMS